MTTNVDFEKEFMRLLVLSRHQGFSIKGILDLICNYEQMVLKINKKSFNLKYLK